MVVLVSYSFALEISSILNKFFLWYRKNEVSLLFIWFFFDA